VNNNDCVSVVLDRYSSNGVCVIHTIDNGDNWTDVEYISSWNTQPKVTQNSPDNQLTHAADVYSEDVYYWKAETPELPVTILAPYWM